MSHPLLGLGSVQVALVHDASYGSVARSLVASSVHHCLCALFIVDPDPTNDDDLRVDGLLREMASAAWRGVDARLLIGGSRENPNIRDATLTARARAQRLGVPTRLLAANGDARSNHGKWLVADEQVLLGSHNWSPGALTDQRQDSVVVRDEGFASVLVDRFEQQWSLGREEGFDVSR